VKTLHVNVLSKQSINMAIRRLNEYKKEVETKTIELAQELAQQGAEIARMKIVEMGANFSGAMLSGVGGYFSPTLNMGLIKVTSDHAVFVEFGTGPQGSASPHPKPTNGAGYKSEGWWTKADGKDMATMYGWQPIVLENGDIIYYTEGQPARPFMYETALELGKRFEQIAREVFAK
jgi:hypothetical protein